jgi:hypothetical protein
MSWRTVLSAIAAASVLCASGCGGGVAEAVTKFDGVTVTVRASGGRMADSSGRYADGVQTWKAGDLEYVVDHMKLSVNGKRYGELRAGDEVLIEGGRVKVNGAERQPE